VTFKEIRHLTQQARKIPLENILLAAGATRDRNDKQKRHTAQGLLSVNAAKFINSNQAKGGEGAISS
jgi:hypothetical protein